MKNILGVLLGLWLFLCVVKVESGQVEVDSDNSTQNAVNGLRACSNSGSCTKRYAKGCKTICPSSQCTREDSNIFDDGCQVCNCDNSGPPPPKRTGNSKYKCFKTHHGGRDKISASRNAECERLCKSLNKMPYFCFRKYQQAHQMMARRICTCYGNPDGSSTADC